MSGPFGFLSRTGFVQAMSSPVITFSWQSCSVDRRRADCICRPKGDSIPYSLCTKTVGMPRCTCDIVCFAATMWWGCGCYGGEWKSWVPHPCPCHFRHVSPEIGSSLNIMTDIRRTIDERGGTPRANRPPWSHPENSSHNTTFARDASNHSCNYHTRYPTSPAYP